MIFALITIFWQDRKYLLIGLIPAAAAIIVQFRCFRCPNCKKVLRLYGLLARTPGPRYCEHCGEEIDYDRSYKNNR